MEEIPSNSRHPTDVPKSPRREQAQEKKVDKIVSGEVVVRKKSVGKRFKETFFSGANAKDAGSYVLSDVVVPQVKDMVSDAFSQAMDRMLYGEVRPAARRAKASRGGHVVSGSQYHAGSGKQDSETRLSRRARANHSFEEIVIEHRHDAEEVLDKLYSLISQYGSATVADFYDAVGVTGDFTDNKYGWTDLRSSSVVRARGGFLLDLPRPQPLA